MMQRMGMQVEQIDGVTRVIIESASKRIVIDDPEVAVVKVQGQTVMRSSSLHRPEYRWKKRLKLSSNLEAISPKPLSF